VAGNCTPWPGIPNGIPVGKQGDRFVVGPPWQPMNSSASTRPREATPPPRLPPSAPNSKPGPCAPGDASISRPSSRSSPTNCRPPSRERVATRPSRRSSTAPAAVSSRTPTSPRKSARAGRPSCAGSRRRTRALTSPLSIRGTELFTSAGPSSGLDRGGFGHAPQGGRKGRQSSELFSAIFGNAVAPSHDTL